MSFIQKLTFSFVFTSGSVGRVLELGSKGRWFETHMNHFFLFFSFYKFYNAQHIVVNSSGRRFL